MLKYLFKLVILLFIGVSVHAQTLQPTNLPTTNAPSRWDDIFGIRGIITMYHETDTFPSKYPAMIKHLNHKYYTTNGNGAPWTELGGSGKAYYTINPAPDSSYVTIKSLDGTQIDTIKFIDLNQTAVGDKNLTMNNSGAGAPSGTVFDRTVNLVLSYNTIGASPLAGSSSLTTVGSLTSGAIPYSLLTGTIPTWNQNTTGTAANITATSNSTLVTLSSLSLPYSQLTGVPTTSATLTVNSSGSGDASPSLYNGSTARTISYNTVGAQPLENQRLSTGNNVTFANTTATEFIKSGATASQILAGDGSVITAGTNITISGGVISAAGGGGTSSSLTMNNSGTGAASGTTFNGSVPQTISYNTIGAYPASNPSGYITNSVTTLSSLSLPYSQLTGVPTIPTSLPTPNALSVGSSLAFTSGTTFDGSVARTVDAIQDIRTSATPSFTGLVVTGSTNATSTTTGALKVNGGIGLGGNAWANGTSSLLTNGNAGGFNTAMGSSGGPNYTTVISAANNSQRMAIIAQDAGGLVRFYEGSNYFDFSSNTLSVSNIAATSSTSSTTSSTGALVVTGGLGVGGASNFGSSITSNSFIKSGHTGTNVLVDDGTSLAYSTSATASTLAERDGSGNLNAVGFFETSDIRLKNVIANRGDMILFKWKPELKMDKKLHFGYSAQAVQKDFPDLVKVDENGNLAVDYIQVLVKKVNDLEAEIKELKKHK